MNKFDQLKEHTIIVADTGEIDGNTGFLLKRL